MIKIIGITALLILSGCGTYYLFDEKEMLDEPSIIEVINFPENVTYEDDLLISQEDMQLDHEVIQYKIVFHNNAIITIEGELSYRLCDMKPLGYFIYITNGKKELVHKNIYREPIGLFLDVTTRNHHLMLGGRFMYKYAKILTSGTLKIDESYSVNKGDSWYVTLYVWHRNYEEDININFKANNSCMELLVIERNNRIGFYSSWSNGFDDGIYFGTKFLPILPFGFSISKDLGKTINTIKGSYISYSCAGHIKGHMSVQMPNGELFNDHSPRYMYFFYAGNMTGDWTVKASGIGFPFKQVIFLIYADIDPHVSI